MTTENAPADAEGATTAFLRAVVLAPSTVPGAGAFETPADALDELERRADGGDREAAQALADVRERTSDEAIVDRALDTVRAAVEPNLLERNGYNAVREAVLGPIAALEQVPLEAIDEALEFAQAARRRAELSSEPNRAEVIEGLRNEATALTIARSARRDLKRAAEGAQARQRITTA